MHNGGKIVISVHNPLSRAFLTPDQTPGKEPLQEGFTMVRGLKRHSPPRKEDTAAGASTAEGAGPKTLHILADQKAETGQEVGLSQTARPQTMTWRLKIINVQP